MRRQAHTNQAFFGNSPLSLRPSPQNWGKNIMGRDQRVRTPLAAATWQAALWPGTGSSRAGTSPRQRGFWEPASPERSTGQRGWKRQPIGMWAGSGGSPVKTLWVRRRPTSGVTARSDFVYGCKGSVSTFCAGPSSTILPRYMIAARSASAQAKARSWVMRTRVIPRRSKILCSWRTLTFVPTKPASSALTRLYLPLRNLPLLGDAASLPYLLGISLFKAFSGPPYSRYK